MSFLKLIVGLGNPGKSYENTRHNIGFKVVEHFVELCKTKDSAANASCSWSKNSKQEIAEVVWNDETIKVVKPLTFMNRSGEVVSELMRFYKYEVSQLVVVHDELDLPFGKLKLKAGGGDAGHNGLRSITECLGSKDYLRLRFGIGKPLEADREITSWVLGSFDGKEREVLPELIEKSCQSIGELGKSGLKTAQNKFNIS